MRFSKSDLARDAMLVSFGAALPLAFILETRLVFAPTLVFLGLMIRWSPQDIAELKTLARTAWSNRRDLVQQLRTAATTSQGSAE